MAREHGESLAAAESPRVAGAPGEADRPAVRLAPSFSDALTAPPDGPQAVWPPPAALRPVVLPRAQARRAQLRCGSCRQPISNVGLGRTVCCPKCRETLHVPDDFRVGCGRCGHGQSIPAREYGLERLCANCGKPFALQDVTLPPHQLHPHAHHVRRHRPAGSHGAAAWAVLILGLTLVIVVLALTIL